MKKMIQTIKIKAPAIPKVVGRPESQLSGCK